VYVCESWIEIDFVDGWRQIVFDDSMMGIDYRYTLVLVDSTILDAVFDRKTTASSKKFGNS
jgi:hypothetical protein